MSNKLYYRDKKFWTVARNVAIGLMLFGVIVLTLHFTTRQPRYEDMLRDTIIVQRVDYIIGYRESGHYKLKSVQGKYYNIEPRDAVRSLDKVVNDGDQVEITYYTTTFPVYNNIRQMTDGETEFVKFHDYRVEDSIFTTVVVSIVELLGTGILWFGLWQRKTGHYTKEKTKELKDRARINKTGR